MNKDKETKKLDAEELEKRVAPFAGGPAEGRPVTREEPPETPEDEPVLRGKKPPK